MRPSRCILLVAALLTAPSIALAQQAVDIARTATRTVSVRLSGAFATARIIGWDRDSIALTGTIGAGSRIQGGPYSATGPVTGMKFWIEAPDENAARANRLELRVPRGARVWIKTGSADLDCTGVTGGLDLNIIGGSVRVTGSAREVIVESMDGAVSVSGTPEFARLKTATGDIVLQGGGEDVSVSTVSGTIRVLKGPMQRGRFESVTGPIIFAGSIARDGDLHFDTHSGPVDLRLEPGARLEVDAATVTGRIENTWNDTRPIAGREGRGMELGVAIATGAPRVTVRSFKGDVRIAAQ